MGKDHNYLDDLQNRLPIMQKVARCSATCRMNALLLKLIWENRGKFRCFRSRSQRASPSEQFRSYAPEVLDSFPRAGETGCVGVFSPRTYSHSLASLASKEDFTHRWSSTRLP